MATANITESTADLKSGGQKLTKFVLRQRIRLDAENRFLHYLLTSFVRFPLKLSPDLPLPTVTFDHLQDLCNKATAIYSRQKPRPNRLHLEMIKNYIFDKWVRGNIHDTDIEFYNFFGKYIRLEKEEPASTQDIIYFHHALLQKHKETEPQFETYGSTEALLDDLVQHLIYSHEQRASYNIKPLFRALIIIIEGETPLGRSTAEEAADLSVSLVRTGITTDLSGPISFTRFGQGDDAPSVTVSLAEAVAFVMELDEREEKSSARTRTRTRDLSLLDQNLTQPEDIARWHGYTDLEDVLGPSTGWITQVHSGKETLAGKHIHDVDVRYPRPKVG